MPRPTPRHALASQPENRCGAPSIAFVDYSGKVNLEREAHAWGGFIVTPQDEIVVLGGPLPPEAREEGAVLACQNALRALGIENAIIFTDETSAAHKLGVMWGPRNTPCARRAHVIANAFRTRKPGQTRHLLRRSARHPEARLTCEMRAQVQQLRLAHESSRSDTDSRTLSLRWGSQARRKNSFLVELMCGETVMQSFRSNTHGTLVGHRSDARLNGAVHSALKRADVVLTSAEVRELGQLIRKMFRTKASLAASQAQAYSGRMLTHIVADEKNQQSAAPFMPVNPPGPLGSGPWDHGRKPSTACTTSPPHQETKS